MSRYCEIDRIGVTIAVTRPTTRPATSVTTSDRSRAISAAASEEMMRNVSVAASRPTRFESSRPATPETRPEPSHAAASTRRTGTPSVAVISRSLASARIAVPRFVKRRNAAVTTVRAIPKASAITCVQLTCTSPTRNPEFDVGRTIERALSLQIHDIAPSRISARPSVAVALTSGSRAASGGPKIRPYANVTPVANNTHTTYAAHWFQWELLIRSQAMSAPIAPTAPNARLRTPVVRYSTTRPTPERAYTPPRASPVAM